jgi:hypothetical protein
MTLSHGSGKCMVMEYPRMLGSLKVSGMLTPNEEQTNDNGHSA